MTEMIIYAMGILTGVFALYLGWNIYRVMKYDPAQKKPDDPTGMAVVMY